MKKIFALALAAVSTVSMFAAIDSQLTIYLNTANKEVEARVASGDTYNPFNAAACASFVPMYSNPSNIGLYLVYGDKNYMELNAPELKNIPVVVVTSREAADAQNFTLSIEQGTNHTEPVYITDLRPDAGSGHPTPYTFELNNSTSYSFTLKNEAKYVEGENSVIDNRFIINFDPAPSICFRYNTLEILGYAGKSLIVKEAATGTEIVNEPSLGIMFSKDLSDKHGRLIVVLDGKEIQIDATPDVTPAN